MSNSVAILRKEMNLWDQILARVETKVNRHSFYTWFKPTSFVAEDSGAVTVRVPSGVFKDWLTKHYAGVVSEALMKSARTTWPSTSSRMRWTMRQPSRSAPRKPGSSR